MEPQRKKKNQKKRRKLALPHFRQRAVREKKGRGRKKAHKSIRAASFAKKLTVKKGKDKYVRKRRKLPSSGRDWPGHPLILA